MEYAEIRWYKFQHPDKKRPVLILTRNSIIDYLGEVTIAPITSTIRDIPTEVYLNEENGLPKECVINLDHIQTVSKDKIGSLITKIDENKMKEVKAAILFAFGFK
jgi:mRNA interferase MazF